MKQYTTDNAKSLITIIGTEYVLAQTRVERGFITPDRMLGTLLERLNRLASTRPDLRRFLDDVGHIPEEEDTDTDLPWSDDPRDPRDMDVVGDRERQQPRDAHNKSMKAHFGSRANVLTRGF